MEYSTGSIRKRRKSKTSDIWEWQGVIYATESGKQRQLTRMLGVECTPPTDKEKGRGRKIKPTGKGSVEANKRLRAWRDELIAAETAKRTSNALSGPVTNTMHVPKLVEAYWNSLDITPETRTGYGYLMHHINRTTLDIPITDLTPAVVRTWLADLREEEVGKPTLVKVFGQLKYTCEWAMDGGIIDRNPCLKRDAPKRSKHEKNPLDTDNVAKLNTRLTKLRDQKPVLADIAEMALHTGMRIGELCALTGADIDGWADDDIKGYIHVNHTIARNGGTLRVKECPKNGERRDIPINDAVCTILARRRETFKDLVENLNGCYVFARKSSPDKYPSPAYLGKQWSMFAAMSDIVGVDGKPPRFHDLRDTFATQALTHGIDVVTVAAILGHKSTKTTFDYYARWMPNTNVAAMKRMNDLFKGEQ